MPTIWLKDKFGRQSHITVDSASWTGDYNTPDTAVIVPQAIPAANRCMNTLTLATPQGNVTINFNNNGRTGNCIQCGQCCSHLATNCPNPGTCGYVMDGNHHRCSHLTIVKPNGIGKNGGTTCDIYQSLMYEGLKGCLCYPSAKGEITADMTNCGYEFP